ncbi:MAG: hypothetical protein JO211_17270 [Acidobacteriaceae bacterium]|nr:hypothetical protein [Acidobacteriaceae bacterium]
MFESRLLCAACLANTASATATGPKITFGFSGLALAAASLLLVWILFYLAGYAILQFRERVSLP